MDKTVANKTSPAGYVWLIVNSSQQVLKTAWWLGEHSTGVQPVATT
jgi:hypothetical protein